MPGPERGWLRAGFVGRPHGLDGSFHVNQPNAPPLVLGGRVRIGEREHRIDRRAGSDRQVIVRLEGFADRPAAQSLQGQQIYVPRQQAPELGPDEWWAEDLEGCVVRAAPAGGQPAGAVVGTVRRLVALPSCEVLEVERPQGAPDLLVPLVSDAVLQVDLDRREIEVDLVFLGEA